MLAVKRCTVDAFQAAVDLRRLPLLTGPQNPHLYSYFWPEPDTESDASGTTECEDRQRFLSYKCYTLAANALYATDLSKGAGSSCHFHTGFLSAMQVSLVLLDKATPKETAPFLCQPRE